MNRTAPRSLRLHVALLGRRNVGKSSLLNAIARQPVSIVSDEPGTTTDPVEKPMELLPLGPVVFVDTAGLDDPGLLGDLRVRRTRQVLERTDLGLVVAGAGAWGDHEEDLLRALQERGVPALVAFNQSDLGRPSPGLVQALRDRSIRVVETAAPHGTGLDDLRTALLETAPAAFIDSPALISDLVGPGEMVVLVVPIDPEAPRGRLIMPQVQAIRDLLDGDAMGLVVKERELRAALQALREPPRLVVTDSQAFLKVEADTPRGVGLTSFSILFSRFKGDLVTQSIGALGIERLRAGDRVLIAEACSHHPVGEDIGRVKIPRWLTQYVGGRLEVTHVQGHDFPQDAETLGRYSLVVHCGSCMHTRREMLGRIAACRRAGVPVTNYGLAIAYSLGILERALGPFPAALEAYRDARARGVANLLRADGADGASGADGADGADRPGIPVPRGGSPEPRGREATRP